MAKLRYRAARCLIDLAKLLYTICSVLRSQCLIERAQAEVDFARERPDPGRGSTKAGGRVRSVRVEEGLAVGAGQVSFASR